MLNCREENKSSPHHWYKLQSMFESVFFHSLSMQSFLTSIQSQLLYFTPEKKVYFHVFDTQAICALEGRSGIVHLLSPTQSQTCLHHD